MRMRPSRLELQGFASFRANTIVDFEGADLFVLSGPTGAGKSTVIDALTFALYGSVARYADARLVEPVISQGRRDARVLLDFTVGGEHYRVARLVQRTASGGATTKEARLEKIPAQEGADPIDLASGAKHVTAEVESLLGLTFDHFCRTVVLPQGAFQDFLHAKPGERQELLVQLLDLGVYRDVAARARRRAEEATAQVNALGPRLEELAGVTEEAIATVAARVDVLDSLVATIDLAQPELDAIREQGAERRAEQTRARADLDRVSAVAAPDGVGDLAQRLTAADTLVIGAQQSLDTAIAARETAEDKLHGAATAKDLRQLAEDRTTITAMGRARATAQEQQEQGQDRAVELRKAADEATTGVDDLDDALQAAQVGHGVHALREHLVAGQDCPLCLQHVKETPDVEVPADLGRLREARAAAELAAKQATAQTATAEIAAATGAERVRALAARLQEQHDLVARRSAELGLHAGASADDPDQAVASMIAIAVAAEDSLAALRTGERGARGEHKRCADQRRQLDGAREQAMLGLRTAQSAVADLGAPPPADDLAASWAALTDWADVARPVRTTVVTDADAKVADAVAQWTARNQLVLESCTRAGVTVPKGTGAAGAAAAARAEASGQKERLDAQRIEAAELAERVTKLRQQAEVARTLGRVLNAKNFEQWLLARALTRLIVGASAILRDLSNGAYSLTLGDDNAFLVADHRNAGEVRHARSLSGGETFLASLALALSLAEHVADLAAKGSARLESLFLDEGFGTLDADTLDVVAASIEELGATGRMVGVITHVRDLAERIPVRFEITKGPDGSQLERIDT
ncbi:MAG: exonuclease SbcC [Glaciecola sp.]|jgi:exonuclease SbcC